MTDLSASGEVIDTPRWWPASSACPSQKAAKLAAREAARTTPAKTPSLAHRTGRRRGTTVSEDRIMPVPYSPLIVRTPSTPKAMTAKVVPARLTETGSKEARCAALNVWYWLALTAENSAPMPIISTSAVNRVHMVDRRERNFVHSERRTRACVTFRTGTPAAGAEVETLIGPLPPAHVNGSLPIPR